MADILGTLLDATPPDAASLDAWWAATLPARLAFSTTIDRALAGGALADRLGFAFASGYAEALRCLVPSLDGVAALCATEEGGNHPRAIRTTLVDGIVNGRKKWATAATHASCLLVVASIGADGERNRLRVARVSTRAPGVRLVASSAPFVPEIPHAEVHLDNVRVDEVLPGDGYDDYLKPFRSVEDLHVHAAIVAYLVGAARRHALAPSTIEALLALAASARSLGDLRATSTHLALAGLVDLVGRVIAELEQQWTANSEEHARWLRDRALLQVAGAARIARRDTARIAHGIGK